MVPLSLAESREGKRPVAMTELRTVVSGTFRRDVDQLREDFAELRISGCRVLSPADVDFVAERDGFVFAAHELSETPDAIEARHIAALEQADFIWLHVPDGYVGPSAALELGVARAFGVPVFGRCAPRESALASLVQVVDCPVDAMRAAIELGGHTPSQPLRVLQDYYERIALARGYSSETAQDTLLLLTEEIGELARAVRKSIGLARSGGYAASDPSTELADVQLYVLHLANVLRIDLADAVAMKEQANALRFRESQAA